MSFQGTPGTCGACLAFLGEGGAEHDPIGRCRLRPELGVIPHTLPRCPKYVEKGTGATYTPPPVAKPRNVTLRDREEVTIRRARAYGPTIELGDHGGENVNSEALKALIRDVLIEEGVLGETTLGKRWEGGTMILKPGAEGQQSKEVPIEAFFHKIVMLRDKLRVLEQKLNGHPKLSDEEKVEMQQYVTRCYGTLTTFNVFFADKADHFVGSKGE